MTVCGYDAALHRNRKPVFHVLRPATLPEALAGVEEPEDEPIDVAEDCTIACYRRGGTEPCICEEDTPGTTAAPGGW